MTVQEWAPAKVNLELRVLGRRLDGSHEVESILQAIDLSDHLKINSAPKSRLWVAGAFTLSSGEDNLVLRAAAELGFRARFVLTKAIPPGAGMGGGSSDAAAGLRVAGRGGGELEGGVPGVGACRGGGERPVAAAPNGNKRRIVRIRTDRVLAGALNTNTMRCVAREIAEHSGDMAVVSVGRKGRDATRRARAPTEAHFARFAHRPPYSDVTTHAR